LRRSNQEGAKYNSSTQIPTRHSVKIDKFFCNSANMHFFVCNTNKFLVGGLEEFLILYLILECDTKNSCVFDLLCRIHESLF
jgi:hypothetical protein